MNHTPPPVSPLGTDHHPRDAASLTYVYPVVSRRAGGVSIGINLNPNAACNWRCLYCQVPNLSRGAGPAIDLVLLRRELEQLLEQILRGSFMAERVAAEDRMLKDVAFSGDGEPTTSPHFLAALQCVAEVLQGEGLLGGLTGPKQPSPLAAATSPLKLIVISNGSQLDKPAVIDGVARLGELGGELWFKVDRGTAAALAQVNSVPIDPERHAARLSKACSLCPTWVQTCMFALDGAAPDESELLSYLELLKGLQAQPFKPQGVLLYGVARASRQPEAPRLSALPLSWLQALATRIEALGLTVRVTP
jgi:hypothetical protein